MSPRCWELGHFAPRAQNSPDLPSSDNELRTETDSPPISALPRTDELGLNGNKLPSPATLIGDRSASFIQKPLLY